MAPNSSSPTPASGVQQDLTTPFRFSPQEPWPDKLLGLPPTLQGLSAQADPIFGLREPEVMLSGLAVLAAAIGRREVVDDGLVQLPAAFNLLCVSETRTSANWLDYLAKAWLVEAIKFQKPHGSTHDAAMMHKLAALAGSQTISADIREYENEMGHLAAAREQPALFERHLICRELNLATLSKALIHSWDGCVTVLNGFDDPLTDWLNLPISQAVELNRMLSSGWSRGAIKLPKSDTWVPAGICLIGSTSREAVQRFVTRPFVGNSPPPILFLRQRGPGKRFPALGHSAFVQWTKFLATLHQTRIAARNPGCFALEPADMLLAECFFAEFNDALAAVPAAMVPFLQWIPELALRMCVITKMCSRKMIEGRVVEGPAGAAMRAAVTLTRWLAQEQYAVLQRVLPGIKMEPEGADGMVPDNTDMDGIKSAILAKLSTNGPLTPRAIQRSFHRLDAGIRDHVIQGLKMKGEIIEIAQGRIALPD